MNREEIIQKCREEYGPRKAKQLKEMLDDPQIANWNPARAEEEAFYDAFYLSYTIALEKAKEKFTPKKYRGELKAGI